MKSRWYANWLLVITLCLLFSSVGVFLLSMKDSIGFTKCAFGDDLGSNCICNSQGEKVCDVDVEGDEPTAMQESISSSDFVSTNLTYSYEFLNFVDIDNPGVANIQFSEISHIGTDLKITVEIKAFCNQYTVPAKQIGFYKLDEYRLTLTIGSNLTNSSYAFPCITEGNFLVSDFPQEIPENFSIMYQDDYNSVYPSNNCVYEGFIRNEGDMYKSLEDCLLCRCEEGKNICEKDENCLK